MDNILPGLDKNPGPSQMASWVIPRMAESNKTRIVCMGATDTGKTHLVASLLEALSRRNERPLHVDLDMGQSTIGPPATLGFLSPDRRKRLYFVGNTSPLGVVPEIRSGLAPFKSLLDTMADCRTVVDTAGLVTGVFGRFLKRMEIEALRPDLVIVIDRCGESRPIVEIAERLEVDWILLAPEIQLAARSPQERARYRAHQFALYFEKASRLTLPMRARILMPAAGEPPEPGRVLGFIDEEGFVVCLGLFVKAASDELHILAPPCDVERIRVIKIGRCAYRE